MGMGISHRLRIRFQYDIYGRILQTHSTCFKMDRYAHGLIRTISVVFELLAAQGVVFSNSGLSIFEKLYQDFTSINSLFFGKSHTLNFGFVKGQTCTILYVLDLPAKPN